jgi:tetratricopeptide (TPR) repeat protein
MYDEINKYDQGSKESQLLCDSALSICPTFPEAYYIKAIPYLKRGKFDIWKTLIDKAVEYDSIVYIGYRGGAQFMFLRNYEEAINDINKLETLLQSDDLGTIYNGEYDLQVIRALSYKGLGDKDKAIAILESHFNKYDAGLYGYYHLGVLYLEKNRCLDAIETFVKQSAYYDFADTNYYLALAYKNIGENDNYKKTIQKAYDLYLDGRKLRGNDSYMDYPDKVYIEQIRKAMIQP